MLTNNNHAVNAQHKGTFLGCVYKLTHNGIFTIIYFEGGSPHKQLLEIIQKHSAVPVGATKEEYSSKSLIDRLIEPKRF